MTQVYYNKHNNFNFKQMNIFVFHRYFKSMKHTFQVDYIKYMDEIAEQIGCRPNLKKVVLNLNIYEVSHVSAHVSVF